MKKRYTVYTKDARFFDTGWQGACRTQSDDLEKTLEWCKKAQNFGFGINWKIVDNTTKKILASNMQDEERQHE